MMNWRAVLLLLVASCSSAQQTGTVIFPNIPSEVSVRSSLPRGGFPTYSFTTSSKTLLKLRVGQRDNSLWKVSRSADPGLTENPRAYFEVVNRPAGAQWVVPIVQYVEGTDCEYKASVIGAPHGHVIPLLRAQPSVHTEGGFFVGDLGGNRGFGLATWDFIWGNEAHVDPHRYRIQLYRYDDALGRLIPLPVLETKQAYASSEEALTEFGLKYPNLLRSSDKYSC